MKQKLEAIFQQYNIQDISCDSRNLASNTAFFAIKGKHFDGNNFINEAREAGAIVITDAPLTYPTNKSFQVSDARQALAIAAGIIYPNLPKNIIAVTGTNGKTSVVSYIYQILDLLGKQVASFGTLGFKSNIPMPEIQLSSLNTPDAITFRKILNELALRGIDNVAFEASSHGIHQQRMGDVKVKTSGFTSFSQDHLDYHKTMEEYLQVKLQLFTSHLEENAEVVISSAILESEYAKQVKDFLELNKIRYCVVGNKGDVNITKVNSSLVGGEVSFEKMGKNYQFSTDIIGSFQATNLLIAVKMVENLEIDFEQIFSVLPKIHAVAGRLERAGKINDDFQIFIDYAHTDDALEKSLRELKKIKHPDGKLYVIFGCGGDRDHPKRYLMGKVAKELADYVVVTDDNPRSEDPAKIRADVLKGAIGAEEIDEREAAIVNTIAKLQKNDILLIAGKGHENYQIIGDKILHFSDIEVARECLDHLKM